MNADKDSSTPISNTSDEVSMTTSAPSQAAPVPGEGGLKAGGSLLYGTYDEGASAAAFQEALSDWRKSGAKNHATNTTTMKGTLRGAAELKFASFCSP